MELRPYQEHSINSVLTKWAEFDRLLGIAPTGSGKTIKFAHIANARAQTGRVQEREPATEKQKNYCRYLGHPNPWTLTKREAGRWIEQRKEQLSGARS
jgi:hypothetical protein